MKNTTLAILVAITLALVCVLLVFSFTQSLNHNTSIENQEKITVTGQGKITLDPDVAYLSFGYENIDIDPQKAQDDNSVKMIEITASLLEKGIKKENIQTVEYNVEEEYVWDGAAGKDVLTGYRVTNMIFVKVEELKKTDDIVNTVFDSGANIFKSIAFDVENKQQLYLEAMDLAIARAEEKAEIYAQRVGSKITGVLEINEWSSEDISSASYSRSYSFNTYLALSYARSRVNTKGEAIMAAPSSDAISTGQVEIIASVRIEYGLK